MTVDVRDRVLGCLLGGALGDSVGWPVEFSSQDSLDLQFPSGLAVPDGPLHPTDDTQMTLFSVAALIDHHAYGTDLQSAAQRAYRGWLRTQTLSEEPTGRGVWLLDQQVLYQQRGPGTTCLTALRSSAPVAESKGCGTTMRTAPAGLAGLADPFAAGWQLSAPTHGHPTGLVAGAAMAWLCASLMSGASLLDAATQLAGALRHAVDGGETSAALSRALSLHQEGLRPSRNDMPLVGAGWVAEEALAVGVFCALNAEDFKTGVIAAADHSGDSDSTASVCGQLLGVMWGQQALPADWLAVLELGDIVAQVAEDLVLVHHGQLPERVLRRYPSRDAVLDRSARAGR